MSVWTYVAVPAPLLADTVKVPVPLILELTVSAAVIVWVPAVSIVAEKVWVPALAEVNG